MKKLVLTLVLFIGFASSVWAQEIGVFGGYGMTNFDESFFGEGATISQSGYIPIGAQLTMGLGHFSLGAEASWAVVPFKFETEVTTTNNQTVNIGEVKLDQIYFGVLAKIKLGQRGFNPYLRGGAGVYLGNIKFEASNDGQNIGYRDNELDVKTACGFNAGAGFDFALNERNSIFVEGTYNFVDRDIDADEAGQNVPKFKADNWSVVAGFQIGLHTD